MAEAPILGQATKRFGRGTILGPKGEVVKELEWSQVDKVRVWACDDRGRPVGNAIELGPTTITWDVTRILADG